jgi:hypothetical protein
VVQLELKYLAVKEVPEKRALRRALALKWKEATGGLMRNFKIRTLSHTREILISRHGGCEDVTTCSLTEA